MIDIDTSDARAVQRAMLRDIPEEVIVTYLRERGYDVGDAPRPWYEYHHIGCGTEYRGCHPRLCPKDVYERTGRWIGPPSFRLSSSLPPGYPPYADDDALPFDGEDRRL